MKLIWILLIIAGLSTVTLLAIINWNNSKVQQIVFTLPLGAIYAALIGIYFTLDSPKIEEAIPVSFIVSKENPQSELKSSLWLNTYLSDTNAPVFPSYVNLDFEIQQYYSADSTRFKQTEIDSHSDLYLELLSFNVLSELFQRFSHGWDLKTIEVPSDSLTSTSIINQGPYNVGNRIKWIELVKNIDFQIFKFIKPEMIKDYIEFPPKSDITLKCNNSSFQIKIRTNYTTTDIVIRSKGGLIGTGILKRILNLDRQTHESYFNHSYVIAINQETNLWRSQSLEPVNKQGKLIKLQKEYHRHFGKFV